MDDSPVTDDPLADQTLAPLKRNHACKECKRRKTKCDGNKPACTPCLRSHAHATRSASRNGTTSPILICTWAEGPGEASPPSQESPQVPSRVGSGSGIKRPAVSQGKRSTKDEENENLRLRIADLEAELSAMSHQPISTATQGNMRSAHPPSDSIVNHWVTDIGKTTTKTGPSLHTFGKMEDPLDHPSNAGGPIDADLNRVWASPGLEIGDSFGFNDHSSKKTNGLPASFGLDDLFVVPVNWPRGLPSPTLLEHLIETFFSSVPQVTRMFHRPTLLAHIKLPPTSPTFPFPGLLHAICACASSHTAWVNNLAPHQIEAAVQKHVLSGMDLTTIEDFGLAQAELANRTVDLVASACIMGGGDLIFQLTQTCILLSNVYYCKGYALKGWMIGGQPSRLLNSLEISDSNLKPGFEDLPLRPPKNSLDRERGIATFWMAFIIDATSATNSSSSPSMQMSNIKFQLPTTAEEWKSSGEMIPNPQTAESEDLFTHHPVADSFVLVVKACILLGKVAEWLRSWHQRKHEAGDEMQGPLTQSFKDVVCHVENFISSAPSALKNVFKLMDTTNKGGFDVDLLTIHIYPNIAIALMHERFIEWKSSNPSMMRTQKAFEAVLGLLHLIPSNLDITVVFTPHLIFSLYTVGRIIANFIRHALETQQYGLAARYRADLTSIQNLLDRYGQRHSLGNAMAELLENYIRTKAEKTSTKNTLAKGNTQIAYLSNGGVYIVSAKDTTASSSVIDEQTPSRNGLSSAQSISESWSSGRSPAMVTPNRTYKDFEPFPAVIPAQVDNLDAAAINWEDWGRDAIKAIGVDYDESISIVNVKGGHSDGRVPSQGASVGHVVASPERQRNGEKQQTFGGFDWSAR